MKLMKSPPSCGEFSHPELYVMMRVAIILYVVLYICLILIQSKHDRFCGYDRHDRFKSGNIHRSRVCPASPQCCDSLMIFQKLN